MRLLCSMLIALGCALPARASIADPSADAAERLLGPGRKLHTLAVARGTGWAEQPTLTTYANAHVIQSSRIEPVRNEHLCAGMISSILARAATTESIDTRVLEAKEVQRLVGSRELIEDDGDALTSRSRRWGTIGDTSAEHVIEGSSLSPTRRSRPAAPSRKR